jgi:hypothetical protein
LLLTNEENRSWKGNFENKSYTRNSISNLLVSLTPYIYLHAYAYLAGRYSSSFGVLQIKYKYHGMPILLDIDTLLHTEL